VLLHFVIIDGIASLVSFSLLFCVLYLLVWNLDVERGIKNEKRLIKPAVVMDTNNEFIWVLSKMVHLCFNCYILESSSCGFGAKIISLSFWCGFVSTF
jgi:hypothetical protein